MVKVYTSCQNELKFLPSAAVQQCLVSFKRQNMIKTNSIDTLTLFDLYLIVMEEKGWRGTKVKMETKKTFFAFLPLVLFCGWKGDPLPCLVVEKYLNPPFITWNVTTFPKGSIVTKRDSLFLFTIWAVHHWGTKIVPWVIFNSWIIKAFER